MGKFLILTTSALVLALVYHGQAQTLATYKGDSPRATNPLTGLTDTITNTVNSLLKQNNLLGAVLVLVKALLSIVLALVGGLLQLVEALLVALGLGQLPEVLSIVANLLDSLVTALGPILKQVTDLLNGLNLG
uniref:Uncharacterized protein n=1 Tax=Megaselia scalaris TaxID=36166 RepID=T1H109_MEGSC